jgi:hypothetical protein
MKKILSLVLILLTLLASTSEAQITIPASPGLTSAEKTLYWEAPAIATTAGTTTFVTNTAYSLPAGTLASNGDRIIIEALVSLGTAAAEAKNIRCNVGYSSFNSATGAFTGGLTITGNISSASNTGSISWFVRATATRTGATNTAYHALSLWEGADISQGTQWTQDSGTVTWANANNILCTVGNTTGANTQVLTLQEVRVFLAPR